MFVVGGNVQENKLNLIVYEELEDYLKGLVYCTKGLKIAQSIKNAFIEACAQDGMGDIYMEMDHTEQAREHFQHAADLFNELGKEEEYEAVMDRIRSLPSKNNSYARQGYCHIAYSGFHPPERTLCSPLTGRLIFLAGVRIRFRIFVRNAPATLVPAKGRRNP